MTLKEYYKRLEQHDWFFSMSDDPKVYAAGQRNFDELLQLAHKHPKYMDLLVEYKNYEYSGEYFGTKRLKKPEEPNE